MAQQPTGLRVTAHRLLNSCPLGCEGGLVQSGIVTSEGELLRCRECTQLISQCSPDDYRAALKKWDTANGTEPSVESVKRHEIVARRRLSKGLRLLPKGLHPVRLLDVGCSSGALLAVALSMGIDATGVEPAERPAEAARAKGLNVYRGYLNELRFRDAQFDVITLLELLEHLTDPLVMLRECARILSVGGILVVNTPNSASWTARIMGARWDGFDLWRMGGHISFFNPCSMRIAAQRSGLKLVDIETRNVRFVEKHAVSTPLHAVAKIGSELLNMPSRWMGAGHDMLVFLCKE